MKILDYYLKTYQGTASKLSSDIDHANPRAPKKLSEINPLFGEIEGFCFPLKIGETSDLLTRFYLLVSDALAYFQDRYEFENWPQIFIASSVLPNQVSVDEFSALLNQNDMGLDNHVHDVSTACTNAASAIELFKKSNLHDVIILGVDLFSEITVSGFNSIGAFAPIPPAPFSDVHGMALGDGIGWRHFS